MQKMSAAACPVKVTADVIGGKWKPLILYFLKEGPQRPGELQRLIIDISKKMLLQQLRELERDGIVARTDFNELPPHVEYSFTEKGSTLKPILALMADWGARNRREQP